MSCSNINEEVIMRTKAYFGTEIYKTHMLPVSDIHTLYIEERGNPDGVPVVFLHGGPGGCVSEKCSRFFDPDFYRIILFDQRGCGKSLPFAELKDNTIDHLVEDIEKIRAHLNIKTWHVFGGSFGSTLALAYAIKYPQPVKTLILRGIFLGRDEDIQWLFQEGSSYLFPDNFEHFKNHIEESKRGDLVSAYYEKLTSPDEKIRKAAAKAWSDWEGGIITLLPPSDLKAECTDYDVSIATLECHYFINHMFWKNDNYILDHIDTIQHIPTYIVHGRYDVDCRPSGAFELYKAHKKSSLSIVNGSGHSPYEDLMFKRLLEIMEELKG